MKCLKQIRSILAEEHGDMWTVYYQAPVSFGCGDYVFECSGEVRTVMDNVLWTAAKAGHLAGFIRGALMVDVESERDES